MMMANAVSTEGRVFVAQLTRDLAAREIAGCRRLAPGTKRWSEAFTSFAHAVSRAGSPTKAAKMFRDALLRLRAAQADGACYVNCFIGRSRSAFFEVLTYEVAKHPLTNAGYDGIVVRAYHCGLQRKGRILIGYGDQLAFVSWHALARMHERSAADIFLANGVVALCGMAGILMRESHKHANTEINYADTSMICTGVLRFARQDDGRQYGFFDVLTVLPIYESKYARKKVQGVAIANAVTAYIEADDADPKGYADTIAVLPFHESDFVSRELREQAAAGRIDDRL